MTHNWRSLEYLRVGTPRQREIFQLVQSLDILRGLSEFDPIVVSTVCIDIDIEESDLDVICCASQLDQFASQVRVLYGDQKNFKLVDRSNSSSPHVVASFDTEIAPVEIYTAPVLVEKQNAYQHLCTFARVIDVCGDGLKEAIRALKRSGLKTEPAFARVFGLSGDPYRSVFELNNWSEEELVKGWCNFKK